MKFLYALLALLLSPVAAAAQPDLYSTNPIAEQILLGNYDPEIYRASERIDQPDVIAANLKATISTDTLHRFLEILGSFHTRHSASDTLSDEVGMGAARRWAYAKFQEIGARNENRLIPSYLEFNDAEICEKLGHRNVFAVLPGMNTERHEVILIEAHLDSRARDLCDAVGEAQGIDDNGSGSALVLELARVMSPFTFDRTIVFMLTTGEEQGLVGADAFARYVDREQIPLLAVLNNDIVGGIICGETASPPGCPGPGAIDSTNVRIFSDGGFNSANKGLARFVKLEYEEVARPLSETQMDIAIMSAVDRTGRGGDHIPFHTRGYTAIRFTSAHEHGHGNPSLLSYRDRQHTKRDILGVDSDGDEIIDSFFVDFRYLARNTFINGIAAGLIALGPETPDFEAVYEDGNILLDILSDTDYPEYRVGVRTDDNDFDTVYTFVSASGNTIPGESSGEYILSVASVDENGVESLFSEEKILRATSVEERIAQTAGIRLMQNKPNPADDATIIAVTASQPYAYNNAEIVISDIHGAEVARLAIRLDKEVNETVYRHGYNVSGVFVCTLIVDGAAVDSGTMTFSR